MSHKPTVSVVVPVYNSESTLRALVDRLHVVLSVVTAQFEVILVNDGSPDRSGEVLRDLVAKRPWLRGVHLMRNYGQHNALLCGIRLARFELIVTMDDDLQHPPEEMPALLAALTDSNRYDLVYGVARTLPHSPMRNAASRLTKRLLSYSMGIGSIRDISAFRAFRSELRPAFEEFRGPNVIIDVLLSWGTNRIGTVPVDHRVRESGRSNYTLRRLVSHGMLMLTGYSTAPLRLASFIGFGFTLFGAAILMYVLGHYFVLGSVPGFPFLASMIAIFSGAQLFVLGIIGEYLARMFSRSLDRPTYVVKVEVSERNGVSDG